jgi:hypothetical protein
VATKAEGGVSDLVGGDWVSDGLPSRAERPSKPQRPTAGARLSGRRFTKTGARLGNARAQEDALSNDAEKTRRDPLVGTPSLGPPRRDPLVGTPSLGPPRWDPLVGTPS